jgi:hypothetical protein
MLVTLSEEDLFRVLRRAVLDALEIGEQEFKVVVVTRQGLARMLGCSVSTIRTLMAEGLPSIRLGDSPRFVVDDCLDWLRGRSRPQ